MMKQARHDRILELLAECEELPLGEIARRLGRVSEVTVRRDVAELADMGKLVRRRGGASRIEAGGGAVEKDILVEPVPGEIEDVDAMVLPPIEGRGADTLRVLARRRKIPFLAESSPQDFGAYLGPDNFGAGRDLGNRAGRALTGVIEKASLLLVSLSQLPNTRARCEGFERGFRETFKGPVNVRLIDSRGSYRVAFERATDVFGVHGEINVVFGVNDHAILAGLDAADRLGLKVFGYSVGGEGGKVFEALAADGPLKACAALFPEIVGIKGIDVLAGALRGEALPIEVRTPHAVLTADNIEQYYKRGDAGWVLLNDAMRALMPGFVEIPARMGQGDRPLAIGFAPHYPAHDWYRGMERAMRRRCDQLGIELRVAAPQAGIAREIDVLRRQIAWRAVRMIKPGETVLVNAGPLAPYVAAELQMAHDITVVTNGLDILEQLSNHASVKVILTSGEYHSRHRCLVGPSLGALFETLRADKALLSVDGITARFGPSSGDERMALAARRFADAAREVLVLADHSLVGKDATHRISPIHKATSLITDTGSLPKDRLAFAEAGTLLTLADGTGEEAGGEGGAWGTDMQKETG
jgi:DeoR/GlpR family transcriptional regulator of sugar metabolism